MWYLGWCLVWEFYGFGKVFIKHKVSKKLCTIIPAFASLLCLHNVDITTKNEDLCLHSFEGPLGGIHYILASGGGGGYFLFWGKLIIGKQFNLSSTIKKQLKSNSKY